MIDNRCNYKEIVLDTFISFKKKGVILASVSGGYFTDEEQKFSDAREVQLTVKTHSLGNDTEKVHHPTAPFKSLPLPEQCNLHK